MGILAKTSWIVIAALATVGGGNVFAGAATDCPDLAGHYRVDGFGSVLGDALQALNLSMAGFQDSEVKITGDAATSLGFWIKSGKTGAFGKSASVVLTRGINYECAGSSIVLKHKVQGSRNTSEGWLEGESSVSLSRSGRGLGLATGFFGRQRSTLYSYDSARISIPKLGTGQSLGDGIRWPHISEPRPEPYVEVPESEQVKSVRTSLTSVLLGNVTLGGLQDSGEHVLASLNTQQSDEVVAFEDRLRAAGISYRMKREPVWSANAWSMQALIARSSNDAPAAWHPSGFRVQHEIERMQNPMVSVHEVEDAGDHYVATLDVHGSESADAIVQRLRRNTNLFSEVVVLEDRPNYRIPKLREVQLRLCLN